MRHLTSQIRDLRLSTVLLQPDPPFSRCCPPVVNPLPWDLHSGSVGRALPILSSCRGCTRLRVVELVLRLESSSCGAGQEERTGQAVVPARVSYCTEWRHQRWRHERWRHRPRPEGPAECQWQRWRHRSRSERPTEWRRRCPIAQEWGPSIGWGPLRGHAHLGTDAGPVPSWPPKAGAHPEGSQGGSPVPCRPPREQYATQQAQPPSCPHWFVER